MQSPPGHGDKDAMKQTETTWSTAGVASTGLATDARYTGAAIALHWIVAVAVVALIAWGWWMQTIPKDPVGPRVDAFNLHKSFGLLVLGLMVLRLAWRAAHAPPRLIDQPLWQVRVSKIVHWLLYLSLFVQPVSGYLGSAFSGYPVKWFGVVLPAWAPKSIAAKDAMSAIHAVNGWVLTILIAIHVAAAARHLFIERDSVVSRMWFATKSRPS
jgi:cytochrome b561